MPATNNTATNSSFARYYNAGGMGYMQASGQKDNQPSAYSWRTTTTTRYYAPNFEREVDGGKTTDYTYIEGSNGLIATEQTAGNKYNVIPTPGIDGAGLQRIIIGNGGEIYYTPDHYETFYKIK